MGRGPSGTAKRGLFLGAVVSPVHFSRQLCAVRLLEVPKISEKRASLNEANPKTNSTRGRAQRVGVCATVALALLYTRHRIDFDVLVHKKYGELHYRIV